MLKSYLDTFCFNLTLTDKKNTGQQRDFPMKCTFLIYIKIMYHRRNLQSCS